MGIVAPSFWRRDVPLPTISGVFLLHDAIDEAGDAAEGLLARIADAVRRDLHATSGSTLKRLRGPWAGRAFRVRWRRLRATVSVVRAVGDAVVVIGKGPPGSGKTIAAIDAARRAVETCHYSVLLLAPTARLRAHYEDALRGAGIPAASVSDGCKRAFEGIDQIWVGETGEFFMTLADVQATRVERERLLDEWWSRVL